MYQIHLQLNDISLYPILSSYTYIKCNQQDRINRFIPQMYELLENCVSVERDSNGNLIIIRPQAKYILVNQDEKIHHSNDVQRR